MNSSVKGVGISTIDSLVTCPRIVYLTILFATQGAYQLKLQELAPADAGAHSHEV
jgi:hypothetical protein